MLRVLNLVIHTIAWCVLALVVLLCAQWPLRDIVQAYSLQANDLAQILFALLASASVAAASLAGSHLTAHVNTNPHAHEEGSWRKWALAACVLPWAAFMVWISAPQVWASVMSLERFNETSNPGFFLIKCASLLMVLLVALQTLLQLHDVAARPRAP